MLKKFKTLLIFLLVVPLMFSITACKDKNESSNSGSNNEQGGNDPSGPDNPIDPETATYTVSFDYNMPERLEGLILDETKIANVGTSTNLPTISDARAAKYFLGWYDTNNELVSEPVTANEDETVALKAKWSSDLNKFYYSDGLTITVDTTNNFATVTGYSGNAETVYLPIRYTYGSYDYLVKYIGEEAFENSTVKNVKFDLESLIIQERAFKNSAIETFDFSGVYELRDECFYGSKLETAELGKYLQTLGASVFSNCKELISADFSKIEIETLTMVSAQSFSGCEKLANVKLNSKITHISGSAFANCTSLASFEFVEESNVEDIASLAFDNCTSLEEIVLPYRVEKLGYDVFRGCENIKKLTLNRLFYSQAGDSLSTYFGNLTETLEEVELEGNMITSIYNYYFYQYGNMTKFTMCDSVETIGEGAFGGCVKLANLTLSKNLNVEKFNVSSLSDTPWYNALNECLIVNNVLLIAPNTITGEVTIDEGVVKISAGVFKDNTAITKVNIPSTVEIIGQNAFYGCTGLEVVNFAENTKLQVLSESVFYSCSKISSINLTNCKALKTIDKTAFFGALSLDTFALPSTVESIADQAFRNVSVKAFEIADNEKYVTETGVIYEKNAQGELVTLVAYPRAKTDTTFVVDSSITEIKNYAFNNARNLKALYVLSNNLTVGQNTFAGAGVVGELTIYSEDLTLTNLTSLVKVYKLVDAEDFTVVDEENHTIELAPTNDLVAGRYFAKIVDGDDLILVRFTTIVSSETLQISTQNVVAETFEI